MRFVCRLHATKRRLVILSSGRTLISQAYHNSVMITEDSEKESFSASIQCGKNDKSGVENDATASPIALESRCFQVPECRVSVCAHEVVELMHRTLHEACTSADAGAGAKVFYQTARDLFFLCLRYTAMILQTTLELACYITTTAFMSRTTCWSLNTVTSIGT